MKYLEFLFDKCFAGLLFILIPCTLLFSEIYSCNNYFINLILSVLIILLCIKNIIKKEVLQINLLDMIFLLLACLSAISSIIKNHQLQNIVYLSLLLYWGIFVLAKPFIQKINFSFYLFFAVIVSNLYVLFRIGINLMSGHDFIPYIEKHFANIGICAIFLAISSIQLLNRVYFSKRKIELILLPIILMNLVLVVYLKSRISFFLIGVYLLILILKKIQIQSNIWKSIIFVVAACSFFLILFTCTKKASSEGRMFILKISASLIRNNILTGTGGFNSFPLNYPEYQADYFASGSGTEQDIMLADNTKYALNEPVQFISELGIIGFSLILLLARIIFLIRYENHFVRHLFFCLLFVSCFYYIFHITVFQVILFLFILFVSSKEMIIFKLNLPCSIAGSLIVLLLSTNMVYFTQSQFIHSLKMEKRISQGSELIDKQNILQIYFRDNPVFLTFYVYELFYKRKYTECLEILKLIDKICIHSDFEQLKGRIYLQTGNPEDAEKYFIRACNICPNRFGYKYDLFKYYLENNQIDLAKDEALKIHNLKEKIPSPYTLAIKLEIERFLEENDDI